MRRTCAWATESKTSCTAPMPGRWGQEEGSLLSAVGRYAAVSSVFVRACSRHAPGAGPITEDRVYRCDAFPDPAHDRPRHRIAERFVAGAIGCGLAAILDQRVIVRESLQPFALAWS